MRYREVGGAEGLFKAVLSGIVANWLVGWPRSWPPWAGRSSASTSPVLLTVMAFVAGGFLHSPANMAYLSLAQPLGNGPGWGDGPDLGCAPRRDRQHHRRVLPRRPPVPHRQQPSTDRTTSRERNSRMTRRPTDPLRHEHHPRPAQQQRELGKISKEQRAGEFDEWQTTLHNPDFAASPNRAVPTASVSPKARNSPTPSQQQSPTTARPLVAVVTDPLMM